MNRNCCLHAELSVALADFLTRDLSSTQLVCADRDRVVLAKRAMLKYARVLLCATQCEPVNAQSCVCGAGRFFRLRSAEQAGPGRCLLHLDKDAVYGATAGGPAPIGSTPPQERGRVIFISPLPPF